MPLMDVRASSMAFFVERLVAILQFGKMPGHISPVAHGIEFSQLK
jgi:hypothetical protein